MAELRNVEVFKVGKWNGLPFTAEDLDDMVSNYNELGAVHKVPLKFGHSGDIPKGQPALGWVSALRREGERLLADFSHVPDKLVQAIKDKRYRTVSIELLMGAKMGKKIFRNLLDAVALLGADQPAVVGLGDLDQFLAERSVAFDDAGRRLVFETIAGISQPSGVTMTEEQIKQLIAENNKTLLASMQQMFSRSTPADDEAARVERERVAKLEREAREAKEQLETFTRKQREETIKSKREQAKGALESAVKAKKLTPAQRDYFTRINQLDDDVAVEKLDLDAFKKTFEVELPKEGSTGMQDRNGGAPTDERPDVKLVRMTRETMSATGKGFMEALNLVAQANPELHRQYLTMNGEAA